MTVLFFMFFAITLVGLFAGLSGWKRPDGLTSRRQVMRFRASIVVTSLVVFVLVPLPFSGQRIYGFSFMSYYHGIGVILLWTIHFAVSAKSEYWAKVAIAAATLLPVWWIMFMEPLARLYRITMTH